MSNSEEKYVQVDEEFSYQMDASRVRHLPPGFRGFIPAKAAAKLKKEGKGKVAPEPRVSKAETAAKKAEDAKKAEEAQEAEDAKMAEDAKKAEDAEKAEETTQPGGEA